MASRKKVPRNKYGTNDVLAQFGMPEIPDIDYEVDQNDSDVDDGDLESELQALLSGQSASKPARRSKPAMNVMDVEKMANECLKDDSPDEDENLSDDKELMDELKTLTAESGNVQEATASSPDDSSDSYNPDMGGTSGNLYNTLKERLDIYKMAQAASETLKDSSRVRRYGRAIKTLERQLQSVKCGHVVNEEDIPPVVAIVPPADERRRLLQHRRASEKAVDKTIVPPVVPSQPEPKLPDPSEQPVPLPKETVDVPLVPSRPAPQLPTSTKQSLPSQRSIASQLIERRNQYKLAAFRAKKCGDNETALMYVKIAKKFDAVIEAEQNGNPIDLSNMPPPPSKYSDRIEQPAVKSASPAKPPHMQSEEIQSSSDTVTAMEKAALEAADEPADPSLFNAPPPPANIMEALQQRLDKYCSTRDAAKAEGNSSKARRLQRIVQQYETAIKNYKAGRPVDFDDLPVPPGFAPIPINVTSPESLPEETKSPPKTVEPVPSQPIENHPQKPSPSGKHPKVQRTNTSSILDKQLQFLLERQKLFRQAALESKKKGDIQQAKEYLRMSKGFDSMIEATKCGLPIDATTIPTPPQLETDFVIVDESECFNADSTESSDNLFHTLEKELQRQIEMCDRNKNHFLSLGDVSSASKFEKFSLDSKKDLIMVQHMWRTEGTVPKFHFETRVFSLVQCNTDLSDSDLEVTIERGINFPGKPEELDSYIRILLPIPNESPQRAKTHTVRDTNNPIFQEVFKFEINRKSRAHLRQFKRQSLNCEVWSKGGFFRGDVLLGTVHVKLVDLETKCCINDCFDLMNGRKICGGRLEVKVRIRDPLLSKQVEEVREKWLVIGSN